MDFMDVGDHIADLIFIVFGKVPEESVNKVLQEFKNHTNLI